MGTQAIESILLILPAYNEAESEPELWQRVKEVRRVLRYDLKLGTSKMRFARTILGYLKMIQRLRRQLRDMTPIARA